MKRRKKSPGNTRGMMYQNVADRIVALGKACEIARLNGATIPCGEGCSACCNYLVPLAVPEVFRLREEMAAAAIIAPSVSTLCFVILPFSSLM